MPFLKCLFWLFAPIAAAWGTAAFCETTPISPSQAQQVDLNQTFATRSPWRLVVTQGPPTEDYGGSPAPGELGICLKKGASGPCISGVVSPPPIVAGEPPTWGPHYLFAARPAYPEGRDAPPLFELITGSLNAGNGSQLVATQLFKYDQTKDLFERIYAQSTGTNNNEEVRFVDAGPLRGSVIWVTPTSNRPFGYWVEVQRFTPQRTYRQVLRYRSATLYNDGNPLAVIDSEMPNIQRRLGLWKPGQPLPLPGGGKACAKPHLKNTELWCE